MRNEAGIAVNESEARSARGGLGTLLFLISLLGMSQKEEAPGWWRGGYGTDGKVGFNDKVFAKAYPFQMWPQFPFMFSISVLEMSQKLELPGWWQGG